MEGNMTTHLQLCLEFRIGSPHDVHAVFSQLVEALESQEFPSLGDVDAGMDGIEKVISISAEASGVDFLSAEQTGRADISKIMASVMPSGGFELVSASLAA
jgi:hypothetical protein